MTRKPSVAILASGSGTTAESFIHACQNGSVDAEVSLVVCNNPLGKAELYKRIQRLNRRYGLNIEALEISGRTHPDGNVGRGQTLAESAAIAEAAAQRGIALIALMGYMKIVRGLLIQAYGWRQAYDSIYRARMINTHPGPLPETQDTYGIYASERVLELGLPASKHTVQLVSDGVDTGPIIAEHEVEIQPGDTAETLFARVQTVEKSSLPGDIDKFLKEQAAYYGQS